VNVRSLGCLLLLALVTVVVPYPVTATTGNAAAGKAIYERLCMGCHGQDGQGGRMGRMLPVPPRNLADQTYMEARSDQQLFDVVKHGGAAVGLSSAMGAFGNQLTDQEIWDTVAYVRTLAAQPPAPVIPSPIATSRPDLRIAQLHLSIWPEYDDPRVLIMFRGEMTPSTAFPTRITLPLPQGADIIGAGIISTQNELLLQPYQVMSKEPDDSLELNLSSPRFFVEFYFDPLGSDANKHFTYTFSTPYALGHLEVDVQEPLRATNFTTDPQSMRQGKDEQGFTRHLFAYDNIARGEAKSFTIAYTKTATGPSIAKSQPEPEVASQPRRTRNTMLMASVFLAGAIVLVGGGAWFWTTYQRRRKATLQTQVPSHAAQPRGSVPDIPAANHPNFCSNCGRKLQPTYRFCPGCGGPIRQADAR
jgi:mono/diheme cytochrome c family protein